MKFLYMVDERILDYIERFCHSVQRAIGMTNFDIARYSALFGIVCDVIYSLFLSNPRSPGFLFLGLVFFVCLLHMIYYVEKYTGGSARNGYANPYKISWQNTRVLYSLTVLCYFGVDIYRFFSSGTTRGLFITLGSVGTTLVFYLLSCSPLPPAPSRLSEFLSKLKPTPLADVRPSES